MSNVEVFPGAEDPLGFEALLAIDQTVLDAIPAAVYVCSADGILVRFNRHAVELWGRSPRPGDTDERFCGSYRLYEVDGTPLPHASTPMETVLRTGHPARDKEVVIERPDGSRINVLVNIEPLKGAAGRLQGAINCFQDITERKKNEIALRESERRLRDILDALPAPIYTTDADGRITFYNRGAAELAGREPELGKDKWCVSWRLQGLDGVPLPHDECPMALALRTKRPVRGVEAIAERPDGTRVPFLPYPTPLFDAAGALSGAVNMLVDMTERREAEKRLQASEARYRRIFDGASVALWEQDFSSVLDLLDGLRAQGVTDLRSYFEARPDELAKAVSLVQVRDVNEYAVELFEADSKEDLLGALGATFLPETKSVFLEEMVSVWEGQRRFESESLARTLKGGRLTVLITIAWGGERRERSLVSILDISKQKASEQAHQRLAAIVESSDDAIVSKDLNGLIVSWNDGAQRLFGYSADEIVGQPIALLIPADRRDEGPEILRRIRGGERVEHYETVRRRKDGHLIDISLTVSPVKDEEGRIVGASKIARDVSGRKRAEEALARRIEEQAALYQFTDRLHRAESLTDVYESALDAIHRALRCDRASILLFDEAGVMRFTAWRGLSDGYRRAVDGHSPWTPDERSPQPILIDDIEAAELDDALRSTIEREGIGALAFIPLVSKGKLVGKFMTYYEAPHAFAPEEVDLAVTIARQLGFSVERMRGDEELRQNEERFRLATQTGKVGLWEWDIASNGVSWTESLYGMHGVAKEEFDSTVEGFRSLVHPDDRERVYAAITRTLEEDAPYELEFRILRSDGEVVWIFTNAVVLRSDGQPVRMLGATVDITERKQAELQRDLLVAELSHRVKNTLATVISIARQSFSKAQSAEEASETFDARIRALAQTHGRLAEANWSGVSFETMLLDELAPYRGEDGGNVRVSGPPIALNPRCALTLGMAIHELATNAAKYGALSSKKGSVEVVWKANIPQKELCIRWSERGGPPVTPPTRSGFGRLLLERALASDLRGHVRLDFAEDGLDCEIAIPLDELAA